MKKISFLLVALLMHVAFCTEAQVKRYDLVINEIMADPSPIVGLPNAEYIELRNNSSVPINLNKWKINKGNSTATVQTNYLLLPDSLVILCSRTQAIFFNDTRTTIGVTSFPSLGNETDLISLYSPEGRTVDAVEYDTSFYGNALKAQGGWSMELVNPVQPCGIKNWKASVNNKGGTPGKENSVLDRNTAGFPLRALQCIATNNKELLLELNMGADSSALAVAAQYQVTPLIGRPIFAQPIGPLFNTVRLQLPVALEEKQVYLLQAKNLLHCNGNSADSLLIKTGIAATPSAANLVINEILFNPPPGGSDFIELYNKGQEILNLRDVYIGSITNLGSVGSSIGLFVQASVKDHHFFPGEYRALTTQKHFLSTQWSCDEAAILSVKTFPSLPDDKGNIVVTNKQGLIVDALHYTEDMHFPLIQERSGVSLERINPLGRTDDRQNWHSASASVRYASPTKINSQQTVLDSTTAPITIYPELISPDQDGINDILHIQYAFTVPGTMLSAYLFNMAGAHLATIVNNRFCGTEGVFSWNGLDQKNMTPANGLYVVLVETFDLNGKKSRLKKTIGIR